MFELPAAKIYACSSIVKLFYTKSGLIISRYISRISLWVITHGFVEFIVPVRFLFNAISIIGGSNYGNTVIEFGTEQIFLYVVIFVIKFIEFLFAVIGILMHILSTFENK